jgi:hypothetical protein
MLSQDAQSFPVSRICSCYLWSNLRCSGLYRDSSLVGISHTLPNIVVSDHVGLVSFNNFCNVLPSALSSLEIQQLLRRQQGLLHPSWFKLVSLEPDLVHPHVVPSFDTSLLSDWDSSDWAPWTNVSGLGFD